MAPEAVLDRGRGDERRFQEDDALCAGELAVMLEGVMRANRFTDQRGIHDGDKGKGCSVRAEICYYAIRYRNMMLVTKIRPC